MTNMPRPFKGTYTALVTPFLADGSIDISSLSILLDVQIAAGIEGVVLCGSTGEGATLSFDEKISAVRFAVERSQGRIQVVAGTGTNDTKSAVQTTRAAKAAGAYGALVVTPYYNKPSDSGLRAHFRAISEAAGEMPLVLYNVPGRTAQNLNAELQLQIAEECPNVAATKESSGNVEQIMEIIHHAPANFSVLAGDDSYALPMIAAGAHGVVSVISNIAPADFGGCVRSALIGDFEEARSIHYRLFPLMKANFIESNPIPVKAALAMMGYCQEQYRLPMAPMHPNNKSTYRKILTEAGIL